MSWSTSASGKREEVISVVTGQMDASIRSGHATEENKRAVLSAVEAIKGETVTVAAYGHNPYPGQNAANIRVEANAVLDSPEP